MNFIDMKIFINMYDDDDFFWGGGGVEDVSHNFGLL